MEKNNVRRNGDRVASIKERNRKRERERGRKRETLRRDARAETYAGQRQRGKMEGK